MNFRDLSEQQILALAISAEEEDGRIYADFSEALRGGFPATAKLFDAMAEEESGHRHRLIELYRGKFGEHIPLIRRADVHGFYTRGRRLLGVGIRPERARAEAARMEIQSRNFYQNAAQLARDATIRQLLGDLAAEESKHEALAEGINAQQAREGQIAQEHDSARRSFVLQIVQPASPDSWTDRFRHSRLCSPPRSPRTIPQRHFV